MQNLFIPCELNINRSVKLFFVLIVMIMVYKEIQYLKLFYIFSNINWKIIYNTKMYYLKNIFECAVSTCILCS